jgi:5-methylthioadenosine/S-adenosylhomocysteine deaminase
LITPAFAPHAPYSLDEARLKQVYAEAEAAGVPMLMHVAEMADEVETFRKTRNQTPVEYLEAIGVLGPRLVAAHAIFVTESDIAILRRRDVGVAHAMVANIKSAKGVAPALSMFKQGVRVGLATDGPMSGNTLDIIGQLGYVAKVHKLDQKNRNVMPAIDVVEMATIGGARALHMEERIGSLEAGKLADLVVIDTDRPAMVPLYDVYSALVYAATPGDVRTTVVHGKVVVEERRVVSVDGAAVRAKMREIGRRVTARVAQGLGSAGGQD